MNDLLVFRESVTPDRGAVLELYRSCEWSAAERPDELMSALDNSHALITAWLGERLVGLVNSISDGALVVYYPHLLVMPEARGQGIASELMRRMRAKYDGFHQQMLVSYEAAAPVYEKAGFSRAPGVVPFWIYTGD